jgi:hypothetical protein
MTDVQMTGAPLREEVYVRQPYEQPAAAATMGVGGAAGGSSSFDRANIEAAELAAFEKGRMQG